MSLAEKSVDRDDAAEVVASFVNVEEQDERTRTAETVATAMAERRRIMCSFCTVLINGMLGKRKGPEKTSPFRVSRGDRI